MMVSAFSFFSQLAARVWPHLRNLHWYNIGPGDRGCSPAEGNFGQQEILRPASFHRKHRFWGKFEQQKWYRLVTRPVHFVSHFHFR